MTAHDDAADQAPPPVPLVPADHPAPTVRDVLASCAAARALSTPPAAPADRSGADSSDDSSGADRSGRECPGGEYPEVECIEQHRPERRRAAG